MIGEFALVMSVKEKKAVVLAPGGRFLQIKNRDFHVGQRILIEPSLLTVQDRIWFAAETAKGNIRRFADRLKYRGLIILSGVVILIPTSAYAATKYVPWTYVSMDTGSISIQYELNARGEVLSTETLNDDAKTVVDSIPPVRYEKVENAIDRALNVIYPEETREDKEKKPVLIGISTRFGNGEGTISTITENMEQAMPVELSVEHLSWPEIRNAREEVISIGQYRQRMEDSARPGPSAQPDPSSGPADPGRNGSDPAPSAGQTEAERPPETPDRNLSGSEREEKSVEKNQPPQDPEEHPDDTGTIPAASPEEPEYKPSPQLSPRETPTADSAESGTEPHHDDLPGPGNEPQLTGETDTNDFDRTKGSTGSADIFPEIPDKLEGSAPSSHGSPSGEGNPPENDRLHQDFSPPGQNQEFPDQLPFPPDG